MKKKLLALTLTICLLFSISATAFATDREYYNGAYYEIITGEDYDYINAKEGIVLCKYKKSEQNVTIPSKINGIDVIAIGENAFYGNTAIQNVMIPENIKSIGANAFSSCTGLQQVLLGKNVETIGESAFWFCFALQQFQIEEGSNLQRIEDYAFAECSALTGFPMPDTMAYLGDGAFTGCSAITSINIPEKITKISDYCFSECNYLQSVTLHEGLQHIGSYAFYNTKTEHIVIPNTVLTIGDFAFDYCKSLKTLSLGNSVKSIGERAFSATAIETLAIPNSCQTLGGGAFNACIDLEEVILGNGVEELLSTRKTTNWNNLSGIYDFGDWFYGYNKKEDGCFEYCFNLKKVTLGDGLKTIGTDCFANTYFSNVQLPNSVLTIGDGAFYESSLISLIIPDSVTTIGNGAFASTEWLKSVHIGDGVTKIGEMAFANCEALKTLYIPSNVTSVGGGLCYNSTALESAVIGNGVSNLLSVSASDLKTGMKTSVNGAFEGCKNLKEITLGNGLTMFGIDVFANTALKTIMIPKKITEIPIGFGYHTGLETMYFAGEGAMFPPTFTEAFYSEKENEQIQLKRTSIEKEKIKIENNTTLSKEEKESLLKEQDALLEELVVYALIPQMFTMNAENSFPTLSYDINIDKPVIAPLPQTFCPEGGYAIKPLKPITTGYLFKGWFKDKACTDEWIFEEDKVTENITLYAKWEAISDALPKQVSAVEIVKNTKNGFVLHWKEVSGTNGYNVYINGEKVNEALIESTEYEVKTLEDNTVYEISISAVNDNGEGKKSLIIVGNTLPDLGYPLGDVNNDNEIDANDALNILKQVVNMPMEVFDEALADVNDDNEVDANDALKILKYVANIITSL